MIFRCFHTSPFLGLWRRQAVYFAYGARRAPLQESRRRPAAIQRHSQNGWTLVQSFLPRAIREADRGSLSEFRQAEQRKEHLQRVSESRRLDCSRRCRVAHSLSVQLLWASNPVQSLQLGPSYFDDCTRHLDVCSNDRQNERSGERDRLDSRSHLGSGKGRT